MALSRTLHAQTDPQTPPPPPKGEVLFERHEPAATDDSSRKSTPDDQPDPYSSKGTEGKPGVSSSQRRSRTTLHRRGSAAGAVPQPQDSQARPASSSLPATGTSSSSGNPADTATGEEGDGTSIRGPLLVTSDDQAKSKLISETDRSAVIILKTELDMHLNAHTGMVETRAQLLARNAGTQPLPRLPLRISGALQWESARLTVSGSAPVSALIPPFGSARGFAVDQYHLADDLDHTGVATELAITLPEPLAPGKTVRLELYYSGTLAASAQRLTAIGAPAGRAALTDWDTVSDSFTGLRGFGNVLWYPVAGPTALLRDGYAVTRAVDASRARDAQSEFHLSLTLEYSGSRPDAAFFCGDRQPLKSLPANAIAPAGAATSGEAAPFSTSEDGVASAEWTRAAMGPHTPSLFIVDAAPHLATDGLLRVVTERSDTVAALGDAAARVRPMLIEWLGSAPGKPLDVIDLPVPGAAGFADGTLLVAPLTTGSAAALAPSLVQPMAAAWLPQNLHTAWLRDGIPAFLQAVWAERMEGRAAALAGLAANVTTLRTQSASDAVSSSQPDEVGSSGIPLAICTDPTCVRGRAAYVLEMLRGMMGDQRLQQAMLGWRFHMDEAEPSGVPLIAPLAEIRASETAWFEMAVQQAGPKDMSWFFQNWVDADRGLPDLAIVTVAPRRVERSALTGYLPQQRKPVAGPIGAEPVPPSDPRDLPDGGASLSSSGGAAAPAAGSWLVAVEVQNNGSADAEVPVTVRAGGLTNTLPLRVAAHSRATIRVPFEADPQEIQVNDGSVPEARSSRHRLAITNLPQ